MSYTAASLTSVLRDAWASDALARQGLAPPLSLDARIAKLRTAYATDKITIESFERGVERLLREAA